MHLQSRIVTIILERERMIIMLTTIKRLLILTCFLLFATPFHHTQAQEATYPFTGLPAPSQEASLKRPIAVMLDNHPNARFHAGLSQADLVYEYHVEGSYTRYLAVFQSQEPQAIGPIRSARPYFVETASDLGAIYTHYGGSPEGNQLIADLSLNDIDGMKASSATIWRYTDTGKVAPHNAYSNIQRMMAYSQEKKFSTSVDTPSHAFSFTPKFADIQGQAATNIEVQFNNNNVSNFTYQEDTQNYQYSKDGTIQVDENDQTPIQPTNIIVHQVDYQPITAGGTTLKFDQASQGEAQLFTAGKHIPIKWTKRQGQPYQYTSQDGKALKLNPGMTWIAFASSKSNIQFQ